MDCEIAQTKYRKTNVNDNLIEQGIQFLICCCFYFDFHRLSTCYTLYYLIISYRAGSQFTTARRILTIVEEAFDVHSEQ